MIQDNKIFVVIKHAKQSINLNSVNGSIYMFCFMIQEENARQKSSIILQLKK